MTRLTPLTPQAHMTQAAHTRRTRMQTRRDEAEDAERAGEDHDEQLLLRRGAHADAQQGALHPGCRPASTDDPGKRSACTCEARLSAGSSPEGPSTRSQTRRGTAAPCLPEEPERNRSTCLTNNDIYMHPACDPIAKFLLYQQQLWRKGLRKSGVFRGFLRRFHGMCYVLGRTRAARAYPPPHPNPLGGTGEGVVGLRGPVGTPPSGLGWNHHHDVIDLPGGFAARPTARAISAAPLLPISPPPSPIVQSVLHARHPSVWPCSAHACFCVPPPSPTSG